MPLITPDVYKEMYGMTPDEVIKKLLKDPTSVTHQQMMAFRRLSTMQDPMMQEIIAPYEHMAWSREYTKDNPRTGSDVMSLGVPMYQLGKMIGVNRGRTPASMDELFAGYQGISQGSR